MSNLNVKWVNGQQLWVLPVWDVKFQHDHNAQRFCSGQGKHTVRGETMGAWFQYLVIPHMISVTCGPFITSVSPVEQILRIPNLGQGMHTIRGETMGAWFQYLVIPHEISATCGPYQILVSPVEPILRIPHGPGGKE